MNIRPARLADVMAVLQDLSPISRQELDTVGFTDWQFLKEASDFMSRGDALTVDIGGPLFVLGSYPDPTLPLRRQLWFMAARRFFEMGGTSVRFGRKFMGRLRTAHPFDEFESTSWSKHPQAARWFTLIGFRCVQRGGDYTVFRYDVETRAVLRLKS